jgi:hypothetical protein
MTMFDIRPLINLSREDLRALARAAVERGEPLSTANVFEHEEVRHRWFENDYLKHQRELTDALTT